MIPGLAPFTPCLPRVVGPDEAAMFQLEGVLPHVPDVALFVLRIPVVGSLERLPVLGDRIPDDRAPDSEDLLGLIGHDHVVDLRRLSLEAPVVEGRAWREREVAVVDSGDEVRRVDLGRIAAVKRPARLARPGCGR